MGKMKITNADKLGHSLPTNCIVCGHLTNFLHYGIPSCYGCKVNFRSAILTGTRYVCSNQALDNLSHIARCRGCRFDRSVLMGMNPLALKLPKDLDINAIYDELSSQKQLLLKKYRNIKAIWQKVTIIFLILTQRKLPLILSQISPF
uniref:Nuclear receptor domain-containing protein n=1 Tax=Ditylenchus dipsaci TaxID=166011 RepID=A0A915E593_9BILA